MGEYRNPPIHAPAIAGAPAIKPIPINLPIMDLLAPLAIGAAIANPSVVLCNVNPTIRKVLRATLPNKTAAPIAKPSPRLCNPIPIDIINAIVKGFENCCCCLGVEYDIDTDEGCKKVSDLFFFIVLARSTSFPDIYSKAKKETIVTMA